MADTRLRAVTVNLTCGQPESRLFNVQWPVGGRAVEESDIRRVVPRAAPAPRATAARSIHALPLTFSADETEGVADPRGLFCSTLTARLHIIDAATARAALARRLRRALRPRDRRGGLRADGGRPRDAGGGRARAWRHRDRHGRRHHRHGGVRRGPVAAHRAASGRRRARHQRSRPAAVHPGGACGAAEDAVRQRRRPAPTTNASCCRCRWSARRSTRSPRCRAAWW